MESVVAHCQHMCKPAPASTEQAQWPGRAGQGQVRILAMVASILPTVWHTFLTAA